MQDTWFTPANAREMAARANAAKRQAAIMREQGEIAKPLLPEEKFRVATIARVRKQMDSIFKAMDEEDDPGKIDRLASALGRLNEIERQLAGRPMPGSLKPSQPAKRQVYTSEPAPIVPETPQSPTPGQ